MIAGIDCQDKSDLPGSSASDWLQTKGCQYRRQCGRSIQYFIAKPEVLPFGTTLPFGLETSGIDKPRGQTG